MTLSILRNHCIANGRAAALVGDVLVSARRITDGDGNACIQWNVGGRTVYSERAAERLLAEAVEFASVVA